MELVQQLLVSEEGVVVPAYSEGVVELAYTYRYSRTQEHLEQCFASDVSEKAGELFCLTVHLLVLEEAGPVQREG